MTEVLRVLQTKLVPVESYIRSMRFFSENKRFRQIKFVNKQLQELGFEPAADLEEGQRALLKIVVNAVRPQIDENFKPETVVYSKGDVNMTKAKSAETKVADINTSAKAKSSKPTVKPTSKSKPASKSTSKVVKVNQEPRKSKKSEKFETLLSMLREAGESNIFVTKEAVASKIGATPGSVGVMISELRKDATLNIESTKQGYRIVKEVAQKVA